MYKETNLRPDFGTGVADIWLYVGFDTRGVCKALKTAPTLGSAQSAEYWSF